MGANTRGGRRATPRGALPPCSYSADVPHRRGKGCDHLGRWGRGGGGRRSSLGEERNGGDPARGEAKEVLVENEEGEKGCGWIKIG
jgi:hypothetical protein